MALFTNHTFSMAIDDDAIPDVLERISDTATREEIERKWTGATRDDSVPLQWKEARALSMQVPATSDHRVRGTIDAPTVAP